jgi:cytochrome P450
MATTSLHALPELPRSVLVTRSRENRLALLEHLARQPGPAVRLTSLGWSVVIALSPELTHEVLVEKAKSFEKSPVLRLALHPLAGQGLFTSEGELWRRQRKLMAPIFQPSQLRGFADTMSACAKRSADELADGVTDMARETTRITMAIAAKTLFDADTFDDADELGEALTVALDWTSFAATSVLALAQARLKIGVDVFQGELPPSLRAAAGKVRDRMLRPILLPTRRNAELRRALDLLEGRVARMIDERRASPRRAP